MQEKGHQILFVVRERESTIELIQSTGFDYVLRGKGGTNLFSKLILIPIIDWKVYKVAKKFKPDLFMSMASPYAAHTAWIMRKPHIALDDTEHARMGHLLYRPFTSLILSPFCYSKKVSPKQILFDSYLDLAYLHPSYFHRDTQIKKTLGIEDEQSFCLIRFVSWDANHDIHAKGLSYADKIKLVKTLEKHCRVYISSEGKLPNELDTYKLPTSPTVFHSVLAEASLYIGEGGTTATEAAILGTPSILVNSLLAGVFDSLNQSGLLFQLLDINQVIEKAITILSNVEEGKSYRTMAKEVQMSCIDITAFLVWFIENYPDSRRIMKSNPDYQNRFIQ